jgi:hypothetical protein
VQCSQAQMNMTIVRNVDRYQCQEGSTRGSHAAILLCQPHSPPSSIQHDLAAREGAVRAPSRSRLSHVCRRHPTHSSPPTMSKAPTRSAPPPPPAENGASDGATPSTLFGSALAWYWTADTNHSTTQTSASSPLLRRTTRSSSWRPLVPMPMSTMLMGECCPAEG